jgi:hypothetical protein
MSSIDGDDFDEPGLQTHTRELQLGWHHQRERRVKQPADAGLFL